MNNVDYGHDFSAYIPILQKKTKENFLESFLEGILLSVFLECILWKGYFQLEKHPLLQGI